jgi:hypothetical protein
LQYTKRINSGATLGAITASFPDAGGTNFNPGSTNSAKILQGDRFDWDVILHEYGHFVGGKFNIKDSPGGRHGLDENIGEQLTKDEGIRLAWSEGSATGLVNPTKGYRAGALAGTPHEGAGRHWRHQLTTAGTPR